MPSREEIAGWLREAETALNDYETLLQGTGKLSVSPEIQCLHEDFAERVAQVENMGCENCRHADFTTAIDRCNMWGGFINFSCGCFSWESKETTNT